MIFKWARALFSIEALRNKIVAVLAIVLVYKFLSVIPVPWVNVEALKLVLEGQKGLAFFWALMWGGLENFSVILMGLAPYINALIIIQLLGVIVPQIGQYQKEGEQGQRILNKRTRILTLPLAFIQSYGMIVLLNSLANQPIINTNDIGAVLFAMLIVTTGTFFLLWLGEIISEYGIGNGVSIVITAWVLSWVPGTIANFLAQDYKIFFMMLIATLMIIYVIIKFTEWHRRIPIIYAKTGRDEKTYFPIRVNQAGMIPIIFAISLVTFPAIIGRILTYQTSPIAKNIGEALVKYFSMENPSWILIVLYFLLVLGFSFFYVSITFNTEHIAETIQKRWGYIPWKRPGKETAEYLERVSARLNLFGGSFLALIAVLPYILSKIFWQTIDFIISAAWLIIVVSVVLEIIRKVESEMKMFDYSKFK